LNKRKNILICPLEWGLGHAARMIPIVNKLRQMDHNIIVASGEEHLALFKKEIPDITTILFTGFKPAYSKSVPQFYSLLFKGPSLLFHIIREHSALKQLIRKHNIDIVISDNRFGLWNKNIKTVYVTHMPLIPFPKPLRFLEFFGIILHGLIIKKYTFCYIPDLPGEMNLSGRLSHGLKLPSNVRFIGVLSRFSDHVSNTKQVNSEHNTVILSGPEPQRGILKKKLIPALKEQSLPTIFLEGRPDLKNDIYTDKNLVFYNHIVTSEMAEIIKGSQKIFTRSGYTTIMDLICLNCTALLIPTPGQTEQEYLAEYLSEKGWFVSTTQNQTEDGIKIEQKKSELMNQFNEKSSVLLSKALSELLG
jgi:spore coat polysaccharide biosynthesis predicted glycosyltransferase SpsG